MNKDTYEYLTRFADDRTILSMLSVNKKFNDDAFFQRVLLRKYPLLIKYKKSGESFKSLFIRMVYAIAKIEEEYKVPYISAEGYNPDIWYKKSKKDLTTPNELLMYSSLIGNMKIVQKIIDSGYDEYFTVLFYGAVGNHIDLVKWALEKDEYADFSEAMVAAGQSGSMEMLDLALANGGEDLDEALQGAAEGEHMKMINFLLDKGADPNSGLIGAAEGGHTDIIQLMWDKGANGDNYTYVFALIGAARGGYLDIVKLMIDKGAENFKSALYTAIREGHLNIVKYLIQKIPEIVTDRFESSFLIKASKGIYDDIYNLLVQNGAYDEELE